MMIPHDFSDPLTIALLLCDSAMLKPSDERNLTVIGLERWLRERGSVSGDHIRFAHFARELDTSLADLPSELFEAAMHLFARSGSDLAPLFAPAFLKGKSEQQIARFILDWQPARVKPARAKRMAKKKSKRSRSKR
jgi:hypothetical protein